MSRSRAPKCPRGRDCGACGIGSIPRRHVLTVEADLAASEDDGCDHIGMDDEVTLGEDEKCTFLRCEPMSFEAALDRTIELFDDDLRALDDAPLDDEPYTDEEQRACAKAHEQVARGEVVSHEEVCRKLGLPFEEESSQLAGHVGSDFDETS